MLTITEQILLTIKNSNKILIDVNTLVKKPIEHKKFYIRNIKDKRFQVLLKFSYTILQQNKIHKSDNNINLRHKNSLKKS